MRTLILFLAILAAGFSAQAQQARLFVLPDSVSIGDRITYTIVMPSGMGDYDSLVLPDSAAFGTEVEYVEHKLLRTASQADSIQYTLQFFGTDDLVLDGVRVGIVNGADTAYVNVPPVVLPFRTVLTEPEPEIRPYKDIFAFALNWTPYILLALALIIAGWILVRYMRRYLKQRPKHEVVYIPRVFQNPLDDLERALLSLRSDATLIERDFKPYFTLMGDAIRRYLEEVHKIPALESTTREVLQHMDRVNADRELAKQAGKVLRRADLVKFARFEPGVEQALESLRDAERFLQVARMADQGRVNRMRNEFELKVAEEEEARRKAEAKRVAEENGEIPAEPEEPQKEEATA